MRNLIYGAIGILWGGAVVWRTATGLLAKPVDFNDSGELGMMAGGVLGLLIIGWGVLKIRTWLSERNT